MVRVNTFDGWEFIPTRRRSPPDEEEREVLQSDNHTIAVGTKHLQKIKLKLLLRANASPLPHLFPICSHKAGYSF
jgi:hypothetical protein